MTLPSYGVDDFAASFAGHKPTGAAWPREADTDNARTDLALMPTYVRSWQSMLALLVDAFPATALQLLPDWESSLGLPDPCAGPDPTIALRQRHVVAQLTQSLGPSIAGVTAFAAALGYAVTIEEFTPARFGMRFGLPFGGPDWAFAWLVSTPTLTLTRFQFGHNKFGDPFTVWNDLALICQLQAVKPAHTLLLFSFGGALTGGATRKPDLLLESGQGFVLLEDGASKLNLE